VPHERQVAELPDPDATHPVIVPGA
jgi:hypothetical protein